MNATTLANFLAAELKVEPSVMLAAVTKFQAQLPRVFSSKKAEKFFAENGSPANVVASSNGKVTMDDIRTAVGIETKSKLPSEWVSAAASDLAAAKGLKLSDFPETARSGSTVKKALASGCIHRISIQDVRKIMLENGDVTVAATFFSSPGVHEAAVAAGLSPSDFAVSGRKIKKDDVKMKIAELAALTVAAPESEESDEESAYSEPETETAAVDDDCL